MKNIKYIFPFLLLLVFSSASAQGSLENCWQNAEKLYNEKQYFDAITEYKRLLFFDAGGKYTQTAMQKIAYCYKGGAKYDDAVEYMARSLQLTLEKEEKFRIRMEIIKLNILRHSTAQAMHELDELGKEAGAVYGDSVNYWKAWAYIFEGRWDKASYSLSRIGSDTPGYAAQLKKTADSADNRKYSVFFAKLISYILPGTGQFYTGHYLSGFMSLAWTSLLAYLSVRSFSADRIFDGAITTGLFFRFHRGNVQNADEFAEDRNIIIDNDTIKYLQNNFKGPKP
ncbi:MAG: hypothetical protein ACM3SM_09225 [Bacteroidota bacterium]